MGKILKIVGWLVGIVVLLLIVAVVVLPQIIDPNDYKDEIVSRVQQETGRTLSIDGDLGLSVFPWLGIEIGAMELSNAEGFEDQAFAAVEHAAVRVKLMPLLGGRLEVDKVGLKGLRLNLAKAKNGTTNWDDLIEAQKGEVPGESPQPRAGSMPGEFTIGGVDIIDARVSWDDRSQARHYIVEQLSLQTGAVAPGEPVEMALSMVLHSKEPAAKAKLDLEAVVAVDEQAGIIEVSGIKLTLDGQSDALPDGSIEAVLEATVKMAVNGDSLEVAGLNMAIGDLKLTGALTGSALTTTPTVNGNLQLAEFNLRQWMTDQGVTTPPMADSKALTRVSASLVLENKAGATRLDDLKIGLDDTRIDGTATLRGEAVAFKVNVDSIDLDRYLPAPAEDEGGTAKPAGDNAGSAVQSAPAEQPLLPVETLRGLNVDGVLNVGRLIVNKLLAEQVQLTVKAKDGRLTLDQKVGKFYQGGYKGNLDLDVRGKTPLTKIDAAASNILIGPLLKDLAGEDRLTGKGHFNANLSTRGNSIDAFKKDLSGKMNFKFEEGAVKGFNLAQTIRETRARFQGEPVTKTNQPQQTDFSELSASGVISEGVLQNQDLLGKSPFLRVNGAGKVNLVSETLDYTLKAVVVATEKGQGGEALEQLKGVTIPVRLTGPFASPKYTIDWAKIILESQKGKIEEKLQEKLEGKIPADLQNQLKGLFK